MKTHTRTQIILESFTKIWGIKQDLINFKGYFLIHSFYLLTNAIYRMKNMVICRIYITWSLNYKNSVQLFSTEENKN